MATSTSFSFNDIVNADWSAVSGKRYIRTDTGQVYGEVFAKYSKDCGKLSALFCDGFIEFVERKEVKERFTKILGSDLENPDAKIFSVQNM
jgi:hypothetical protein